MDILRGTVSDEIIEQYELLSSTCYDGTTALFQNVKFRQQKGKDGSFYEAVIAWKNTNHIALPIVPKMHPISYSFVVHILMRSMLGLSLDCMDEIQEAVAKKRRIECRLEYEPSSRTRNGLQRRLDLLRRGIESCGKNIAVVTKCVMMDFKYHLQYYTAFESWKRMNSSDLAPISSLCSSKDEEIASYCDKQLERNMLNRSDDELSEEAKQRKANILQMGKAYRAIFLKSKEIQEDFPLCSEEFQDIVLVFFHKCARCKSMYPRLSGLLFGRDFPSMQAEDENAMDSLVGRFLPYFPPSERGRFIFVCNPCVPLEEESRLESDEYVEKKGSVQTIEVKKKRKKKKKKSSTSKNNKPLNAKKTTRKSIESFASPTKVSDFEIVEQDYTSKQVLKHHSSRSNDEMVEFLRRTGSVVSLNQYMEEVDPDGHDDEENDDPNIFDIADIREFQDECLDYIQQNSDDYSKPSKYFLAAKKGFMIASCKVAERERYDDE
jgi:hypothetical protein